LESTNWYKNDQYRIWI